GRQRTAHRRAQAARPRRPRALRTSDSTRARTMSGFRTLRTTAIVISPRSAGIRLAVESRVPSLEHEIPLELIRACPEVVRDLLRVAEIELPDGTLELIGADLTQIAPAPFLA